MRQTVDTVWFVMVVEENGVRFKERNNDHHGHADVPDIVRLSVRLRVQREIGLFPCKHI